MHSNVPYSYPTSSPAYNWASAPEAPPSTAYYTADAPPPSSTTYYSSEQPHAQPPPTSSVYYMTEQTNPSRPDLQSNYGYSSPSYSNPAVANPSFQPIPAADPNPNLNPNSSYQYSNANRHSSTPYSEHSDPYPQSSVTYHSPASSQPAPYSSSQGHAQYAHAHAQYAHAHAPTPAYSAYQGGYDSPRSNFAESNVHSSQSRDNYGYNYSGFQEPPRDNSSYYGNFNVDDGALGGDVYAYDGGKSEPYGARGTRSKYSVEFDDYGNLKSSKSAAPSFDDYGNLKSSKSATSSFDDYTGSTKIAKAIPKVESQDSNHGVQKFRVKLLPDHGNQSAMDVLCQIGLDGIRMLDPTTNRTLRIYSLEHVTRWEVTDPAIFSFWSKTSVDPEPKRIRLQSNRYTSSTILDTVAAACVQFREMVDERPSGYSDTSKTADQPAEKKGSITDWMKFKKPVEEKDHWVPDEVVSKCTSCGTDFGAFVRRHHCRNCGDIFCDKCTQGRTALTADKDAQSVRVCDRCLAEVTHRLANAKEASNKTTTPQRSHEDLAKRLMEEMGKNRKGSSESGSSLSSLFAGLNTGGGNKRTKEVACPTCTVHLQVQVPSSGTETVECGVCQHPFLVSAQ